MGDELVFTVDNANATAAAEISPAEAGLTERAHLQKWIIAHPEILGIGVRIVTCECDSWWNSARGELAGLTMIVKRPFGRKNWPFRVEWAAGGDNQAYYVMDEETALLWLESEPDATESPNGLEVEDSDDEQASSRPQPPT